MLSQPVYNFVDSKKYILITIICLAFISRLSAIYIVGDRELTHEYATYVPYLLEGKGFSYYSLSQAGEITESYQSDPQRVFPSAFKPPVYPLILVVISYFFGMNTYGILVIEFFQVILGLITCWIVFDIAFMKFDFRVAFFSLILVSFYPLLIFSTSQISDATLQVFLVTFSFWLLFKIENGFDHNSIIFITGLTFGILIVARTETLAYLPFILIWIYSRFTNGKKIIVQLALLVMLVVSVWGIRNYEKFNTFTLNTSGGLNLWEGQNPNAKGVPSWYTNPSAQLSPMAAQKISEIQFTDLYEIERDSIYATEAVDSILASPVNSLYLAIKKVFFYWSSIYPGIDFIYQDVNSPVLWLPWFMMLPFFVVGLIKNFRSLRKLFLFYMSFFLSTLTIMMFFVLPRYIVFILPWVLIFAASGFVETISKWFPNFINSLLPIQNEETRR